MTNELTRSGDFMPVHTMETAVERFNAVAKFAQQVLKDGIDYSAIPGAGNKKTLLKPGAEKLTTFFGLSVRYVILDKTLDWMGTNHGGEPFLHYEYRCQLYRGDLLIAESDGSCNSWEKKYRYRAAERVCPSCGRPAIIKGKQEYGGGWLCFRNKGGCGQKYRDGDSAIEGQATGQAANPDVADLANTIQKMAQKRALVAAVLVAVNASEFFTQDLEDIVIEGEYSVETPKSTAPVAPVAPATNGSKPSSRDKIMVRLNDIWAEEREAIRVVAGDDREREGALIAAQATERGHVSSLTDDELLEVGKRVRARIEALKQQPATAERN